VRVSELEPNFMPLNLIKTGEFNFLLALLLQEKIILTSYYSLFTSNLKAIIIRQLSKCGVVNTKKERSKFCTVKHD
jgi:hypothetical protein